MYEPQPIDTSAIKLPPGLLALLERLAEHNHDVWAQRRLAEGWRPGPERNDQRKEHPCLVPYEDLPNTEQEYDRQTSLETLKAILALGFRIEPPPPGDEGGEEAALLRLVEEIDRPETNLAQRMALWRDRHERQTAWDRSPAAYRTLARKLLSDGAPLIALEVVMEGRQRWERDTMLRQIQGLALARTGAAERANVILKQVRAELETEPEADDHAREETLGTLARTHKDLALLATSEADRNTHWQKARELYAIAFEQTGRYWTGINVVTLATLAGTPESATLVAEQVRQRCQADLDQLPAIDSGRYWAWATLGEEALNRQDWPEAEKNYRLAALAGAGRFGDLNSTRRQAKLLIKHLGREESLVDQWLPMPRVAVFTGHMIDQKTRPQARFPPRFAEAVKASIERWLSENNVRIGFSSAACGSDLLFQEAMQEIRGESHLVLPYNEEQFVTDSVAITEAGDWAARFQRVLRQATQVIYASKQKMQAGSVSYDYANLVLHGLATVRARELQTDLRGLAVWNGGLGDGPGGTASVVARWHGLGVPVSRVDLSALPASVPVQMPILKESPASFPGNGPASGESETKVMAMLFADAVNFSQLTEEQVPRFVQHFLGAIADLIQGYAEATVVRNTWGDGLYLVFKTVRDAGLYALELRDVVTTTKWIEKGLPEALSLRIALHAGPVFGGIDPVTGQQNYTGTHVSRAARLEPKTPPGEVYASEAFAALTAVEQVSEFLCEYVKQLEWAKHYGTYPTYVVRRAVS